MAQSLQGEGGLEPLGGLSLEQTKTGVPRRVPVHPTLARVLAEWKLAGWERMFGRPPTDGDLVVPTRNGTERSRQEAPKALRLDLEVLKLRDRRGHDLRRTSITLAQVDGARRDLLQTVSHGPRGDIMSMYTTYPWPSLCEEIAKLKIELREAISSSFRRSRSRELATPPLQTERARRRWNFLVTPSGIGGRPNVTVPRLVTGPATEGGDGERLAAVSQCNGCNEALDAARHVIAAARRLALVADNAIANGDHQRARAALRDLHGATICGGDDFDAGSRSKATYRSR